MRIAARMTSKGQLTVPKPVREALGLTAGSRVVFTVEEDRAELRPVPGLIDLAGTVPVPEAVRGAEWDVIRREAHRAAAQRGR